ncbi:MAG: tetratricopeptide repeat protein, partial [Chloroflexi bacterium]|nr:tetratricopeptide repeat protein [Chloroflexota bacterium]
AAQPTDQPATEIAVAENAEQNIEAVAEATEQPVEAVSEMTETAAEQTAEQSASEEAVTVPITARKETVTVAVQTTVETFTDSLSVTNTSTETSETLAATDVIAESAPQTEETPATESEPKAEAVESSASAGAEEAGTEEIVNEETVEVEDSQPESIPSEAEEVQTEPQTPVSEVKVIHIEEETIIISEAVEEKIVEATDQTNDDPSVTDHAAYEEYLKDNAAVLNAAVSVDEQADEHNAMLPPEPAAKIDSSGEFRIEVDAKNAHVWNELGNVYFNTGEIDDAVVAYSKAIELDRWFAWPYSNLALAYVQKGRFVEAILLYQRSIELFASEKDKAISWNRLGNVYRRLNDYDNAIASYQRADELDPDNTTLSLQSRFSLLGSYAMEPKPSYAS